MRWLAERGKNCGAFKDHAAITQGLKFLVRGTRNSHGLDEDMREALEMIQHKVGQLVANRLNQSQPS